MTDDRQMKLIVDHVSYTYNKGTNLEVAALEDISLVVHKGEFLGIIGQTGSGKSTLLQHLNGLLRPDEGSIYLDGEDVFEKGYDRKRLRAKVGLVFQYPEHQLFADTVFEDVCFGPVNIGMSRKEAELKAYEALKKVGLEDECFYQSPFDLSGGQKRRAAVAGVLAMQPEILVLDEPAAGLDPKSRGEMLDYLKKLQETAELSVVLVSHSMEDVAGYADRVIIMKGGRIYRDDAAYKVLTDIRCLESAGLRAPQMTYLAEGFWEAGIRLPANITTVAEAKDALLERYKKGNHKKGAT